ncbi:MAG: cytochrome b/b6 domain-containing protein [Deltaproteobacteria bacterium]|nr:cytochrome b/b6 domain-containing protein [Deltaproteobacteria bacterium]MBW2446899.1 cytochrome b/b6 domain-containing protein [Deltaproteobacteria bacterium]
MSAEEASPRPGRSADPPVTVERFGKTVRWFHWTFALSFVCLAATGGLLVLRNPLGVRPETAAWLLTVHEAASVFLVVVPTVVVLSGSTREFFGEIALLFRWSRDDLRWLTLQPLSFVKAIELPAAGKLNAGQKVNGIVMGLLTVALLVSGGVLYLRPGALLPLAIHIFCFVVWIPLFIGHLGLALVMPGTRPALRGMVTGRVSREWARHHHPRWIEELEAGDGVSPRR